ncbi:hypothetical protein SSS_04485 [Sarcoptes scabiei]|uniref:Uncharacterized protein n=1 Tax=Sarcoptes scabiei TaxID=52283 RepID=A0A834R925_SARSC|nr:hypothetical protein SSS_04485 [Sarcoptes scabiei]
MRSVSFKHYLSLALILFLSLNDSVLSLQKSGHNLGSSGSGNSAANFANQFDDYDGPIDTSDPKLQPSGGTGAIGQPASASDLSDGLVDGDGEIDDVDPQDGQQVRTKFSDERFARLFPSRNGGGGRFEEKRWQPREIAKPKPTLPSFIKSTPALIKVQITTPSSRILNNQRQRQQISTVAARKTTTVKPNLNLANKINNNRQRQLSGRLPLNTGQQSQQSLNANNNNGRVQSTATTSTTSSPLRKRLNSATNSGNSNRFNRNNGAQSTFNARSPSSSSSSSSSSRI